MKSYSAMVKYKLDSDTSGLRMSARVPVIRERHLMDEGVLKPYFDTLVMCELYSALEMLHRGTYIKWFSRGYK